MSRKQVIILAMISYLTLSNSTYNLYVSYSNNWTNVISIYNTGNVNGNLITLSTSGTGHCQNIPLNFPRLYISSNYGQSFNLFNNTGYVGGSAISSNGSIITVYAFAIYQSKDYGNTFINVQNVA